MPRSLYRVFSYLRDARPDTPGGALYIPPQGKGRVDNPEHYQTYYAALEPEGAVAEVIGPRTPGPITSESFRGSSLLHGSVLALATVQIPSLERLCDLDDPSVLIARDLRPSRVITRDYNVSQAWALAIFREKRTPKWIGVSWWSYYEGRLTSVAVWTPGTLKLVDVEPLTRDHPALRRAAQVLRRVVARMA